MPLVSMLRRVAALRRRMPLAAQQVHTSAGRGSPVPTMSVAGRWAEGVLTIREEESVAEAVRIMAAHDVGCLVVMDSAGQHVKGIVTERVYSREIILKGRDSDVTPVGDVMKTDVVYVKVDEKLGEIAEVLSTHGVRHLPVLEGDVGAGAPSETAAADDHVRRLHTPAAQLKGVLSIKDVCWMLFCLVRNELQGRGIGAMTVMDVLDGHPDHPRKGPFTIQMGASVLEAIEQMAATDAHALCVLDDNGGLLGILTERDYVAKIKLRGKTSAHSKVEDIMTATPQCASPSFTLDDVLQLFTTYGFRHLPVVSNVTPTHLVAKPSLRPQCVGLISISDVLRTVCAWPDRPVSWPGGQPPLDTAV